MQQQVELEIFDCLVWFFIGFEEFDVIHEDKWEKNELKFLSTCIDFRTR
jgi:hypothetical protein